MATLRRIRSLIELDSVPSSPSREDGENDEFFEDEFDESEAGHGEPALCGRCRRFDFQAFASAADHRRGYLLSDVRAAADAPGHCGFCALLFDSVRDVARPKDVTENELNLLRLPTTADPDMYVHMTMSEDYRDARGPQPSGMRANRMRTEIADRFSEVRNASDHELCLAAEPESAAAINGDVTGRYLGPDPTSEAHYDAIQSWISECSTSHPKCNQTVSGTDLIDARSSPLPARCVEITKPDGRLYLRETGGKRGTYITLTHRWNDETETCKTTTANYEDRVNGRGFDVLPKLFRDVLAIAARLDVPFVWIDSLCIIQSGDSGADWRREAPQMAQYYQFSLLTIAGTATDMTDGLLHPYAPTSVPWSQAGLIRLPYRSPAKAPTGPREHFFIYRRSLPLIDAYLTAVRDSILFRRGWILQEWLLSKRLLWYTPSGLVFECHTAGPRTEYREQIHTGNITQPDLQAHLRLKAAFQINPDAASCGGMTILDFWYRALEMYSACSLTKPEKDRVLAVAGLAKEVGLILARKAGQGLDGQHEVYLAGLWLRDLHRGLLWEEERAEGEAVWTVRVEEAPSWSWAALMTRVKWPVRSKGERKAARVVGVCQRKRRGRHEGADYVVDARGWVVKGGILGSGVPERARFDATNMFACLHLRGKLRPVHVRGYLETDENLHTAAFATAYSPTPKSPCQWRAICAPEKPEVIIGWASLEQLNVGESDRCADAGIAVHALHVSTRYLRSGLLLKHADPVLDLLFLEEINGDSGVFRRLGVGRAFDTDLIREFETTTESNIQLV